ncbi:hypothetical protein Bbelb_105540 [Branchiostoma belcheri]|nr:hypothetical protein Bbelb_105540 [Branchiostoma belcheri]
MARRRCVYANCIPCNLLLPPLARPAACPDVTSTYAVSRLSASRRHDVGFPLIPRRAALRFLIGKPGRSRASRLLSARNIPSRHVKRVPIHPPDHVTPPDVRAMKPRAFPEVPDTKLHQFHPVDPSTWQGEMNCLAYIVSETFRRAMEGQSKFEESGGDYDECVFAPGHAYNAPAKFIFIWVSIKDRIDPGADRSAPSSELKITVC